MHSKKARVLAIVALCFVAVFTVSLILLFIDLDNRVYMGLTLSSGLVGLILFFIVRAITKERKYLVTEEAPEPEGEGDGSEPEDTAEGAQDGTETEEQKKENGG